MNTLMGTANRVGQVLMLIRPNVRQENQIMADRSINKIALSSTRWDCANLHESAKYRPL